MKPANGAVQVHDPSSSARQDLLVSAAAGLLMVWIGARLNLGERVASALSGAEILQLDEWPLALLVAMLSMLWFAVQRTRAATRARARAEASERQLAVALADNRSLAQEYVRVQEAERRTIAHELHDELGQYLTAVQLAAVALRADLGDTDGRRLEAVDSISRNTGHVITVVAGLIRQLRPVALDTLGLAAAIEHCVAEWRQRLPHLRLSLVCSGDFGELGESLNLTLYRLVQESLTNVMKHANATEATVTIVRDADQIRVAVADNGTGPRKVVGGLGISGMRERANALGGQFTAGPTGERGYQVEATLPVKGAGSE